MNRNWGNQKANPALKTKAGNKQVGFFKKNPIERSAATTAAADDADVS